MEFQDKTLNCVDCGTEFIWTAGEQLFFADKNFKNEPKRCKSCKAKRASRPSAGASVGRERVETTTNCSALEKKRPYRSVPPRDVRYFAANVSSRGSLRARAAFSPPSRVGVIERPRARVAFSLA